MYLVSTFYKFVDLPDCGEMRQPLLDFCHQQGLFGSILLAEEGINATVAGPGEGIEALMQHLRADARLGDIEDKRSSCEYIPFKRMKVRLKKEIVRLKMPGADPRRAVGTYIPPAEWNTIISDPDVILIDTRNAYEYHIGSFKGAINPDTEAFGEFPEFVAQRLDPKTHKKVAMFCTGGIRCEKATSYLVQQGFEAVYHLRGGILKYLEDVPAAQSLWEGECFVFDERVSVDHDLAPGKAIICPQCKQVIPEAGACGCAAPPK